MSSEYNYLWLRYRMRGSHVGVMNTAMADDLSWASDERRELIRKIKQGLAQLCDDRDFWESMSRHLHSYRGPDQDEAVALAQTVRSQLESMKTAMNFGLEWLSNAMNAAIADESATESAPSEYRAWILDFAQQSGDAVGKVRRWLHKRARNENVARGHPHSSYT